MGLSSGNPTSTARERLQAYASEVRDEVMRQNPRLAGEGEELEVRVVGTAVLMTYKSKRDTLNEQLGRG